MDELEVKPVSRTRRAYYAYITTIGALGGIVGFGYFGGDGQKTLAAIDALSWVITIVAPLYIGGSVIDYSDLVSKARSRFNRGGEA